MPDKIKSPYMRIKNYTLYLGGQDFSISALNKPKQLYYYYYSMCHAYELQSPRGALSLTGNIHETYKQAKSKQSKHGKHPQ